MFNIAKNANVRFFTSRCLLKETAILGLYECISNENRKDLMLFKISLINYPLLYYNMCGDTSNCKSEIMNNMRKRGYCLELLNYL